jgi:hypothetical protein
VALTIEIPLPALDDIAVFGICHRCRLLPFKRISKSADIYEGMTLTPWQRANVLAALNYLKDIGRLGQNPQAQTLAQGLMEVLEPSRRTIRLQREAAQAAAASAQAGRERRSRDRRRHAERRKHELSYTGPDRRTGRERRSGKRRSS